MQIEPYHLLMALPAAAAIRNMPQIRIHRFTYERRTRLFTLQIRLRWGRS